MCCLLTQGLVCSVCPHQLQRSGKTQFCVRDGSRTFVRGTKGPDWLEGTWLSASWPLFLHLLKFSHCSSDNVIGKMSLATLFICTLLFGFWGVKTCHRLQQLCSWLPRWSLFLLLQAESSSSVSPVSQTPTLSDPRLTSVYTGRSSIGWTELWRVPRCLCLEGLASLVLVRAEKWEHHETGELLVPDTPKYLIKMYLYFLC